LCRRWHRHLQKEQNANFCVILNFY
jgi:hypothetical protein